MNARFSPLTLGMAELVEAERGAPASDAERARIEAAAEDRGLSGPEPPAWALQLVTDIAHGKLSDELVELPAGVEVGPLSGVLLASAIEELASDDYGEGIERSFERIGVRFFLNRESPPTFYAIRPTGSLAELNQWLRDQYSARRKSAGP